MKNLINMFMNFINRCFLSPDCEKWIKQEVEK